MAEPSPSEFVFSTESAIWEVNSRWTGMVFGPAAAILQIAHPKVAHGVARHSNFKSDALGRLTRTLADVNSIAFGTWGEAEATKKRLFEMHSKVRGTSDSGVSYHALDQDLLVWVLATLVMASVQGYELVYGAMSEEQRENFLRDMVTMGRFFRVSDSVDGRTSDWAAFENYYNGMIDGDLLGSDPICGELARYLVKPQDSLTVRLLGHAVDFVPIETLPAQLLGTLTLKSTRASRAKMRAFETTFPAIFKSLPEKRKYYDRSRLRCFEGK